MGLPVILGIHEARRRLVTPKLSYSWSLYQHAQKGLRVILYILRRRRTAAFLEGVDPCLLRPHPTYSSSNCCQHTDRKGPAYSRYSVCIMYTVPGTQAYSTGKVREYSSEKHVLSVVSEARCMMVRTPSQVAMYIPPLIRLNHRQTSPAQSPRISNMRVCLWCRVCLLH